MSGCFRHSLRWDNVSTAHGWSHAWPNKRQCRLHDRLSTSVAYGC